MLSSLLYYHNEVKPIFSLLFLLSFFAWHPTRSVNLITRQSSLIVLLFYLWHPAPVLTQYIWSSLRSLSAEVHLNVIYHMIMSQIELSGLLKLYCRPPNCNCRMGIWGGNSLVIGLCPSFSFSCINIGLCVKISLIYIFRTNLMLFFVKD